LTFDDRVHDVRSQKGTAENSADMSFVEGALRDLDWQKWEERGHS
jgi:hypothetical protein